MCLAADIPLIESGTSGYVGQVQPIKKDLTECFDCTGTLLVPLFRQNVVLIQIFYWQGNLYLRLLLYALSGVHRVLLIIVSLGPRATFSRMYFFNSVLWR